MQYDYLINLKIGEQSVLVYCEIVVKLWQYSSFTAKI